jgi:hypothetical protein
MVVVDDREAAGGQQAPDRGPRHAPGLSEIARAMLEPDLPFDWPKPSSPPEAWNGQEQGEDEDEDEPDAPFAGQDGGARVSPALSMPVQRPEPPQRLTSFGGGPATPSRRVPHSRGPVPPTDERDGSQRAKDSSDDDDDPQAPVSATPDPAQSNRSLGWRSARVEGAFWEPEAANLEPKPATVRERFADLRRSAFERRLAEGSVTDPEAETSGQLEASAEAETWGATEIWRAQEATPDAEIWRYADEDGLPGLDSDDAEFGVATGAQHAATDGWRWPSLHRLPERPRWIEDPVGGDDEDEADDEAYELRLPGALLEDPRRRAFFHHSSSDDHHGHRRQRGRDPERNFAFGNAAATMTAFIGLALFMILLVTVAIVAGTAAVLKKNQESQPGNPKHVPVPLPAPRPRPKKPPVGAPPISVPKRHPAPPVLLPPVLPPVPVPPVPVPPLPVPVPPVPPAKRPPVRPVRKPPTRGPAPRRPPTKPTHRPKPRNPSKPKLPLCKNVTISLFDIENFGSDLLDLDPAFLLAQLVGVPADSLPGAPLYGIVGVCRPDSGDPAVKPGSPASTISYPKPPPGGGGHAPPVTLDVARAQHHSTDALTPAVTSDAASMASSVTADATSAGGVLTSGQQVFAADLAADTGLDPDVIAAWIYLEENGSFAAKRQSQNNNDWLNVGYTDGGTFGASDSIWSSPDTAAQHTASWMTGSDTAVPGYPGASPGVQAILTTAHQSWHQQIAAIRQSGWASSGYPGFESKYLQFRGMKLPPAGASTGVVSPVGGQGESITLADVAAKLHTLKPADFAGLTTQDLENAVAALNGGGAGATLPVGDGPARVQKMLLAAKAVLGSQYSNVLVNHDAVDDTPAQIMRHGTDCSGFVSYLMGPNGASLWTQSYATPEMSQAPHLEQGPGHYVTIRNNKLAGNFGHVFIEIDGHWFEDAGGVGVQEMKAAEVEMYNHTGLYTQTFHPAGM